MPTEGYLYNGGAGVSSCFFISSNSLLQEVESTNSIINLDNPEQNSISICKMSYYKDVYSGMKYANEIEYHAVSQLQVNQILNYIKDVMVFSDIVELWSVWVTDYGNPIIKTKNISLKDLSFDFLYEYLMNLEKLPYFTTPLHHGDDESNIHYKLEICR